MELNGTIFLQILIFLTILLWLSRSLFAPILRLFEERERRIEGARAQGVELNALALEKARTFDVEYQKAREKARHSLLELKLSLEKQHGESLMKVKHEAKEKLIKADRDLSEQTRELKTRLHDESQIIAEEVVNALLRRTV